jgi:flagellar assembly protein FliH
MSSIIKTARISETPLSLERSARQPGERRLPPREPAPVPVPRVEARVAAEALAPVPQPVPAPPLDAAQREAERQDLARRQERAEREAYEKGLQKATAEFEKQRGGELQRLRVLVDSLEAERNRFAGKLEDGAVEIVFESLVRLLGQAFASSMGVAAAVREVINQHAAGQKTLALRMAPADLELLGEAGVAAIRSGLRAELQFEPDERVQPGGCLIDMPSGSLDARLDFQLERLKQALLDARRSGD